MNTDSKDLILGACRDVDEFEKIHRIGEGTYGTVYGALDKKTKKLVALKRIILYNEDLGGFPLTSIREINCLKQCHEHQNVVALLDVVVGLKRDQVFLVFEYCEHDLSTIAKRIEIPFSEGEIKTLLYQLLSAVQYLHEKKWIIHRDIKLSNLLYNNQGQLKLADFGLARAFTNDLNLTQNVVTLWYRAPELLLGETKYSFPIDLWAIGCTFGELLLHRPMLPGENEKEQIFRIFSLLGSPNSRIWPELDNLPGIRNGQINLSELQSKYRYNNIKVLLPKITDDGFDLLNRLLAYDPKKRYNCSEALRHEYFYSPPYPKEPELMPTFPTFHQEVGKYL